MDSNESAMDNSHAANNFTPRAQRVLMLARKEADRFHHGFVGTEHLLLGLLTLGQGTAVTVLQRLGLVLEVVRDAVERMVGTGSDGPVLGHIPYTPRVKKVLSLAAKESRQMNHTYVGTEHILLGLLMEGDGAAARVLRDLDINAEETRQEVLRELDPDYALRAQPTVSETDEPASSRSVPASEQKIDTNKRYDIYCGGPNQPLVVYRDVLIKARRKLLPQRPFDVGSDFLELEQANGQVFFVSRRLVYMLCEHGAQIAMERLPPE